MTSYRKAGVDLEGADRHVHQIGPLVTATWDDTVVGGFGGFAAGLEFPPGMTRPVLMMSTDGVGTKLELARRTGRWDSVGYDLVAMCVDDLAAAGAHPIGFVDYLAVGSLDPERDSRIVGSIARACAEAGCALLGGETAEHPGVMGPDQVDLAGTAAGVVEHGAVIDGTAVEIGDVVVGIPSPNLRSNGFSLVRYVLGSRDLDDDLPGEDATLGEVLTRPSVIYTPAILAAIDTGAVHGAAHITGGGIPGNLSRVLPQSTDAELSRGSWEIPNVFDQIRRMGDIPFDEMVRTFNLGIGFCLIVDADGTEAATAATRNAGHECVEIGRVVAGEGHVRLI